MKKILIIQTAFIGDVIVATPIIEKVQQQFPDAKLDFLLRKGNEALLQNHPLLNDVLIWNKKQNKTKNLFSALQKIRRNKYDLVINCQRFLSTGILTAFSNGKEKIGFNKNPLAVFFTKKINIYLHFLLNIKCLFTKFSSFIWKNDFFIFYCTE